ncbi:hypothetical protein STVA_42610 [Allostella vacuolata]|nr:hypothetical protein STVA_42610 [Stella vacuolata]
MAGYPTAIAYPATHQPRIAPAHLATVAALAGTGHPAIDRPYRFCELGAGTGFTANLLAAANPFAEFEAIDFNPAHVAAGRELAEAGALPNVRHHALAFDAAAASDLAGFDFVALHGVWTWVGDAARRGVLDFLARKVRPGGLVYVSYTARPGMDGVAALRRTLEGAGLLADDRPGPERLARVRDRLGRLRAALPDLGERDPTLARYVEALSAMDEASALHDFLAPDWRAEPHGAVRAAMAEAGLAYLGDADLAMNRPDLVFPPEQAALVGRDAGGEALKDLLTGRPFRRDVYRRPADGDGPQPPLGRLRWLWRGDPAAEAGAFSALARRLEEDPATLQDLAGLPGIDAGAAADWLLERVLGGQVVPLVAAMPAATGLPRLSPFNRAALALPIGGEEARVLAAPAIGGGVAVDRGTAYMLAAVASSSAAGAARALARRLASEGRGVTVAGRTVLDPAALEAALAPGFTRFRAGDLPRLQRLGVVG